MKHKIQHCYEEQVTWLALASPRSEARLFADMWRPLVSVITTVYHVAIIFQRRVWYRALSLRYACIQSYGIILIL